MPVRKAPARLLILATALFALRASAQPSSAPAGQATPGGPPPSTSPRVWPIVVGSLIFAPAYGTAKKNATDIRLAIDALELVFTRPEIGTFVLLSGDSDFSSMVIKLKEYGKYALAFEAGRLSAGL